MRKVYLKRKVYLTNALRKQIIFWVEQCRLARLTLWKGCWHDCAACAHFKECKDAKKRLGIA